MPVQLLASSHEGFSQCLVAATIPEIPLPGADDLEWPVAVFIELDRMCDRLRLSVEVPRLAQHGDDFFPRAVHGLARQPCVRRRVDLLGRIGEQSAIHPDDRHLVGPLYQRIDAVDEVHAEYRIVRPSGELLWLSGRGQVTSRTADGRAQRMVSIMADITERKANEQRIQALMRELAHRSTNLMTVVQAIGRTIGWIGHAIEQYATGQIIRPRAKYVGPVPATA